MTLDDALELLGDVEDGTPISYPQFDSAILGIAERFGMNPVICYDKAKVIQILMDSFTVTQDDLEDYEIEDGMTIEDKKYEMAIEWYNHNTIGGWIGDYTPVFVEI